MGDALRRLFLAIGIALGLAAGQSDPSLFARLALEGDRIAVSARVEQAFAPGALELVAAGTRVALRFSAQANSVSGAGLRVEEIRSLCYKLRSGRYEVVYGGGKTAALVDPMAAQTLACELSGLALCRTQELPEGARVVVRAEIGLLDSRGAWHDAPVLWNYSAPRVVLGYGRGH